MALKHTLRESFLTLCGIGYLPAPGTIASITSVPLLMAYELLLPQDLFWRVAAMLVTFFLLALVAVRVIAADEKMRTSHDRSSIVIDELLGMHVALLPMFFLSLAWWQILLGLAAFRFFDIVKPLGIKRIDRMHTPGSVVWDDVAAGLLPAVILTIIAWYS